jgi:uncharacterized protein (TIGR02001 family)
MHLFMSLNRSTGSQPQPLAWRPVLANLLGPALAAAAFTVAPALAQTSVSASITSEYSVRGISLSRGRPAPQVRLDVDGAAGWYAGAMASRIALLDSESNIQLIAYGGYAQRLPSGFTWEAGALKVWFPGDESYRYHEFYAGLARDRVGGRLYVSPSYYGGGSTAYAELNGSYPLRDRTTLIGHVGLLHPFGGGEARNRLDLRLGIAVDVGNCNLQLALLASGPRRGGPAAARALVLSAMYAF